MAEIETPEPEPNRCIRLVLPDGGHFDITIDVAEDWLQQLKKQLYAPGAHDDYPVDFEG